ncbi:RNA polymerase sigma factor [Bacillus phage Spock]|uniref:RNA polymerase sigma factor n=2 Tax=Bequatrovirus spock TaxID=1918008 RepID=A0A1X9SG87_9CAUD|nr:RNA polymerase sigma factor [Bacillus phage Spock]AGY48564.1 RNA polymerase sigma factor [Bacillus phage Spock]ARQ95076.1 RNA polymerase sigma factor [Bacillus phage Flapjack]
MARNVEKEKELMLNGNRFLTNTDAHTGVFSRDVDKLFVQYKNLRMSVYNQYKGYLSDAATRAELWSYISEQFVRLVKEYEINGAVDFPGYVQNKLTLRVKNSFIKGNYRDRNRVFVTKNEVDVTNLLERVEVADTELDYYETLEYVLQGVSFDEMEKDILYLLMQEHKDTYIEQTLRAKYQKQGVTVTVIREKIADVQEFVKFKLEAALEG